MYYFKFTPETLAAIQQAFYHCTIELRGHYRIIFSKPVVLTFLKEVDDIPVTIRAGNKALSAAFSAFIGKDDATVGFQWSCGNYSSACPDESIVETSGFTINSGADDIIRFLVQQKLLDCAIAESFKAKLAHPQKTSTSGLFKSHKIKPILNKQHKLLFCLAETFIQNKIAPVQPKKKLYPGEGGINPAYQNLAQVRRSLSQSEIRIWALRSDLILATGIKNAYAEDWWYEGLKTAIAKKNHRFINWADRAGHPSLTVKHKGYVCKRK